MYIFHHFLRISSWSVADPYRSAETRLDINPLESHLLPLPGIKSQFLCCTVQSVHYTDNDIPALCILHVFNQIPE
jgi:hypothetical protein